jgi:hypothetical protein
MEKILFLFLFASSIIQGEIFEIGGFKEIDTYLAPGTMVILDIDDTLLVPVQMLGCDEWFQSRLRCYEQEGLTASESLEKSLAEWEAVRHLTKMEVVEEGTEETIQILQDRGYVVMGLTTQGLALAMRTRQQLMEHRIDLSCSALSYDDHYFIVDGRGILHHAGILYTSGTHKGLALFTLLDQLEYLPKRILFINDKHSHLLSIEETAKERGVEFVGLRYAYSDARKAAFDEEIAHYQFTHSTFVSLLSDEEVRKQLRTEASASSPPHYQW